MSKIVALEGKLSGDMEDVIQRAKARAGDCDGIVVVMQKKSGGLVWDGPDSATLERTMFLLWSALMHLGNLND